MHIQLAIIDENTRDADLIRGMLARVTRDTFSVRRIPTLEDITVREQDVRPDVILLGSLGATHHGREIADRVAHAFPHVPTVALLDADAASPPPPGIEDCLIRGTFTTDELARSVHRAIGRVRCSESAFDDEQIDAITGLANRYAFRDDLTRAVVDATASGATLALLLVDVGNFRRLVAAQGATIGNEFLRVFASTLVSLAGDTARVARIGSDEYALILEHLTHAQPAIDMAVQLLARADQPLPVAGVDVALELGIGVAFKTPKNGFDQHDLLEGAGAALCTAKRAGTNKYCTYTEQIDRSLSSHIELDSMLRSALRNNEFQLYYQPIVDTGTLRLVACEALIRWLPGDRRPVLPGRFLGKLERLGMMSEVGEFALRTAIRQRASWTGTATAGVPVCVNISASQFAEPGFASLVQSLLAAYGLDPTLLTLEITESLLLNDHRDARSVFYELSDCGVKFSLDDFGTGHNSYCYLKHFPISTIKIDRSFVRLLHVDRIDHAIARSQITLARDLGLQVIAEGVENHIVLRALEGLAPDGLQGFLLGRPMPHSRFVSQFVDDGAAGSVYGRRREPVPDSPGGDWPRIKKTGSS